MGGKKQKSIIPGPTLILDPRVYLHPKLRNCKYPDNPGKIQVSKDFSYKLRTLILVFYSCNIIMIQFTTNILSRDIWGTLKWAKFSLLPRGYTALLFGKVAVFMKSSKGGETTFRGGARLSTGRVQITFMGTKYASPPQKGSNESF